MCLSVDEMLSIDLIWLQQANFLFDECQLIIVDMSYWILSICRRKGYKIQLRLLKHWLCMRQAACIHRNLHVGLFDMLVQIAICKQLLFSLLKWGYATFKERFHIVTIFYLTIVNWLIGNETYSCSIQRVRGFSSHSLTCFGMSSNFWIKINICMLLTESVHWVYDSPLLVLPLH